MKRFLTILASYAVATYIEAASWRVYTVFSGSDLPSVLAAKPMLTLLLAPITFPAKYLPFFYVRTPEEFGSVFTFYFASLVTFVAAFIGAYLLIRNGQRLRESGRTLDQD